MPERGDEPVHLAFQPVGLEARWRYALLGRPLLWRTIHDLQRLPPDLAPAERHAAQQRAAWRLLRHLRVRLHASGLSHAHGGPFLVAPLHEGITDVLCLARLALPLRFVARDEIFTWPQMGRAITRLGHLAVNPESGARGYRALLRRAGEVLADGESVVVFPQGSVLGIETDFQPGVFALARTLGAPILPVVLTGTHRVWGHPFTPELRYGVPVGLRVLPPLDVQGLTRGQLEQARVALRREMKRVALTGELPPPRRYVPQRDGYWDGFRFDIDPDFSELYALLTARRQQRR